MKTSKDDENTQLLDELKDLRQTIYEQQQHLSSYKQRLDLAESLPKHTHSQQHQIQAKTLMEFVHSYILPNCLLESNSTRILVEYES